MNVGKICHRPAVTVSPGEDLTTVARLMRERHVGYLIVVDPKSPQSAPKPIGVLTDRDVVVTVLAREANAQTLTAGDIMNSQPITVDETDSLRHALQTMRRAGVRRLPVLGRAGELAGIIALDDIIDLLAGEIEEIAGVIRNEQRIEGILRT